MAQAALPIAGLESRKPSSQRASSLPRSEIRREVAPDALAHECLTAKLQRPFEKKIRPVISSLEWVLKLGAAEFLRPSGDNIHMRIPSGLVHQGQLDAEIREAASKLAPDVVHLKYRLGEDLTGDPSIFFRIVLADSSSAESTLADVTGRVAATLFDEIRPFENWGLHPYFNFRSQSEQQRLHDPEWE